MKIKPLSKPLTHFWCLTVFFNQSEIWVFPLENISIYIKLLMLLAQWVKELRHWWPVTRFRALRGLEVRALGPWKSNATLLKFCLRAQWTLQNWRIGNVFQWRDPSNFAWGPWNFKWWGSWTPTKMSTQSPVVMFGLGNGLLPVWCQAIPGTSVGILLTGILLTEFCNKTFWCHVYQRHTKCTSMKNVYRNCPEVQKCSRLPEF